jgi:hypothetical protein
MDELERAGRAVRATVPGETEPSDRVRARARAIVRHRRMFAAGSIATAVIAASVGIAIAASGDNGLGIHTIAPAESSTTRTLVTTHVVPKGTTVPVHAEPAPGMVAVSGLPVLAYVDTQHAWRVEPIHQQSVEYSSDGGRSWVVRLRIAGTGDQPQTVQGIIAFDDNDAIALGFGGDTAQGAPLPSFLVRTTDGIHWSRLALRGLPAQLVGISFVDPLHGWGVTRRGDVVTTSNGGDQWRSTGRPPATGVVVCLGAPGSGWVATGTTVYRSEDNGATWVTQLTIPTGGGSEIDLVCRGNHAAYASYSIGAGQHIGGFLRTDDGGAHWRALTEDLPSGATSVTAPGFPENQYRGIPIVLTPTGALVFLTGCGVCSSVQNWVVFASPRDRFVVGKFDKPNDQFVAAAASGVDASQVFAEIMRTGTNGPTNPVSLYASSDGGQTWQLRWSGQ